MLILRNNCHSQKNNGFLTINTYQMKSTYTLFLLTFLLIACKKEEKPTEIVNNWKDYKLSDNVKSVTEKSFALVDGKIGEPKTENQNGYNSHLAFSNTGSLILEKKILMNGNLLEETTFTNKDKKLLVTQYINPTSAFTTKYSWDDNGNNTIITRRNPQGEQIEKTLNTFIKNQRVEVRRFDGKDNLTDRTTNTFGKNDKVREEKAFLKEKTIQFLTDYTYDEHNNMTMEQRLNPDYKRLYTINNKYNAQNLLIETVTLNAQDKMEYSEVKTYDAKGNLTSNRTYDGFVDGKVLEEFQYDKNNNLIQRKEIINAIVTAQLDQTYDDKNNLITERYTGKDKAVLLDRKTAYEYDSHGNWIKKTITISGVPKFVVERKIEYFK